MPVLGIIADDFTGAADAASFIANNGIETVLYNGVPHEIDLSCDAVVIALKTRNLSADEAVDATMQAAHRLQDIGIRQFYIKCCSTFDSLPTGNIGPVVDAMMTFLHTDITVLDPALPQNGRTLRDGTLYVNGVPLAESLMKDHPLTPMWASSIQELMAQQGRHRVVEVSIDDMADRVKMRQLRLRSATQSIYVVPEHWKQIHEDTIVFAFGDLPLLTGGSALAGAWGKKLCIHIKERTQIRGVAGRCLILAGSCSAMTRKQISYWQSTGRQAVRLQLEQLVANKAKEIERISRIIKKQDCLVYASADPTEVAMYQAKIPQVGVLIEQALAQLACIGEKLGVTRLITAGGETSGEVAKALGFSVYRIGESIAPGVPILIPLTRQDIRIVLKSGNFGGEDFFLTAYERTGGA